MPNDTKAATADTDQVSELERRIRELEDVLADKTHTEALLRESEERFRSMLEGAFEGLAVAVGGKIVEANAAFAALAGMSRQEVIGRTPLDLATPESAALALEHIRLGVETPYEPVGRKHDGTTFPCEVRSRNIVYRGQPARLSAFRDLSESKRAEAGKRQLEERMLHMQRLEQLGVLAGGIAHDFNNLLLVVMGHADLALARVPNDSPLRTNLGNIRTAALRASDLTKQMLTYAGRSVVRAQPVDLSSLVEDIANLLQVTIAKDAQLVLQLDPSLPMIDADAGQLQQVIMNLITNAAEAIGDKRGTIRVRTLTRQQEAGTLGDAYVDDTPGPGARVVLEVEDDGCGIEKDTLDRIFDPFFSTKFTGRGLGLASVLGIVRAHHGAVRVTSTLGRGSHFTILFPVPEK